MTMPPIQTSGPKIAPDVPWTTRIHLQQLYSKIGNHTQAFGLIAQKISSLTGQSQTIIEQVAGGGGGGGSVSGVGTVNDQTGQTAYTTSSGDNGALIILSDASPIALTLAGGALPYFVMVANIGAGAATLTPSAPPSGTSTISYAGNAAASSMPLPSGLGAICAYDGVDWWALLLPIVPASFTAPAHEFFISYNESTGVFAAAQPVFTDISGQITTSQLPASGISATITTAQLTSLGTQGSMTFVNGLLVGQVQAT